MSLRELRRHVGRLAIVGFSGHSVPPDLARFAAEFDLGGVIYFARNIVEPRQVAGSSRQVAALAKDWPLWVSLDQEGGRVARLKAPFTEWPPAITIGRSGDTALAHRFGTALAVEMGAVGINLDFAPVLDVHTNPKNPIIGDRAFSERPEDAARLGAAFIAGMQGAGVAACGKHFPGHGDTSQDSHEELPVIDHDRRRLDAIELVPFRRAVAAQVAMIMTAHVLVPSIHPERSATFVPALIQHLLKDEMAYDGVVVSDDLGMKAVSATMGLPEAMVNAMAAGCDAVLLCNSTLDEQIAACEAVIRAAEAREISSKRLEDAFARQHRVKGRFLAPGLRRAAAPGLDVIGCEAHQAVAREMATWR